MIHISCTELEVVIRYLERTHQDLSFTQMFTYFIQVLWVNFLE
uniref:Uncharacterized protein n=1 Tax=Arundo donax TaxID=35708 RepID=A0A0A9A183_ARUDO